MQTEPHSRVVVTRCFAAPQAQVFEAWLDPAMIGRWMFGPAVREEEVLRIHLEAKVGGHFSFLVRRQGQEIDHVGTYLEIARPRRLQFTWAASGADATSQVLVEVASLEAGCEVTLSHSLHPEWAAYASGIESSWNRMLTSLALALGE